MCEILYTKELNLPLFDLIQKPQNVITSLSISVQERNKELLLSHCVRNECEWFVCVSAAGFEVSGTVALYGALGGSSGVAVISLTTAVGVGTNAFGHTHHEFRSFGTAGLEYGDGGFDTLCLQLGGDGDEVLKRCVHFVFCVCGVCSPYVATIRCHRVSGKGLRGVLCHLWDWHRAIAIL